MSNFPGLCLLFIKKELVNNVSNKYFLTNTFVEAMVSLPSLNIQIVELSD